MTYDWSRDDAMAAIDQRTGIAMQALGIAPHFKLAEDTPNTYRLKIINSLKAHTSLAGRDYDYLRSDSAGLDEIESMVVREAMRAAHNGPVSRPVTMIDSSGRKIIEFVGDRFGWAREFRKVPIVSPVHVDGVPRPIPYHG